MQNLFFWRYRTGTRNYPGYHLSLDTGAAQHVRERLQSRLSMRMDRPVKFDLKKPSADVLSVPNNGHHKAISKSWLEITVTFDDVGEKLRISEMPDAIEIILSASKANELLEGIDGLSRGENDYAMWGVDDGGTEHRIWFW